MTGFPELFATPERTIRSADAPVTGAPPAAAGALAAAGAVTDAGAVTAVVTEDLRRRPVTGAHRSAGLLTLLAIPVLLHGESGTGKSSVACCRAAAKSGWKTSPGR